MMCQVVSGGLGLRSRERLSLSFTRSLSLSLPLSLSLYLPQHPSVLASRPLSLSLSPIRALPLLTQLSQPFPVTQGRVCVRLYF